MIHAKKCFSRHKHERENNLEKMDHQIFVYLFYSITNHSAHCMMGEEGPTLSTVSLICVYVAITRFVQETLFVY